MTRVTLGKSRVRDEGESRMAELLDHDPARADERGRGEACDRIRSSCAEVVCGRRVLLI